MKLSETIAYGITSIVGITLIGSALVVSSTHATAEDPTSAIPLNLPVQDIAFEYPDIDVKGDIKSNIPESEVVEEVVEEEYVEEYYEGPTYSTYDGDFRSAGVIYGEDGTRYTWYSQNVLPGDGLTELNNNGRHVDDRGFVCDGDGYIAVASNDHPQGTIVDTPFGEGRVYDNGCDSGTIDIYTDF